MPSAEQTRSHRSRGQPLGADARMTNSLPRRPSLAPSPYSHSKTRRNDCRTASSRPHNSPRPAGDRDPRPRPPRPPRRYPDPGVRLLHALSPPHSNFTLSKIFHSVRAEFGTYHDIFASTFQHAIDLVAKEKNASQPQQQAEAQYSLTVESYDVVNGDHPREERVKSADGLLITGSGASLLSGSSRIAARVLISRLPRAASTAHDDEPWILSLVDYIQRLPTVNPNLKTIGICFGQQVISRAYGTKSNRNDKGWEIGVHAIELTERGRQVFAGRTQLVSLSRVPGLYLLVALDLH